MNKGLLFVALTLLIAVNRTLGDVPITKRANNFYEAITMFFEQKFRAKDVLAEWKTLSLDYNHQYNLDEKGNCYNKSPGEVLIVLQVEKDGLVSDVFTSKENEKAKCFVRAYKGVSLPKPPIAPVILFRE